MVNPLQPHVQIIKCQNELVNATLSPKKVDNKPDVRPHMALCRGYMHTVVVYFCERMKVSVQFMNI